MGWSGYDCNTCIPYPGCQHGSCNNAFECQCDENWGGLMCNLGKNHHHSLTCTTA